MKHERRFSKGVFGAQYRLEVAAEIVSGRVFSLTELWRSMDEPPSLSSLQMELKNYEQVGLLIRQDAVEGMREVYYLASDSFFWQACRELLKELTVTADTSARQTTRTYSDNRDH